MWGGSCGEKKRVGNRGQFERNLTFFRTGVFKEVGGECGKAQEHSRLWVGAICGLFGWWLQLSTLWLLNREIEKRRKVLHYLGSFLYAFYSQSEVMSFSRVHILKRIRSLSST